MTIKDLISTIMHQIKLKKSKKEILFLDKFKNYFFYLFSVVFLFFFYTYFSDQVTLNKEINRTTFEEVTSSKEFKDLRNFFTSKVKSPYIHQKYIIQNNDSIESILRKYEVKNNEIKFVVSKLKERKLSNIYTGRELSIVIKQNENLEKTTLISILYPVSNTLSIEIRKNKKDFIIKENILQLYKKEVVVENEIKNNLYSAAINVGIEPNIIIEFARIYGFEIDFQRDIRIGDSFEIYYEKFIDDNNVVRDTGKIIYASMKVNGREINLYNFKIKNDEGYFDLEGKSIVKSLMKTPINGARLSSSFGMRKHPILGFNKMHRGTDFAAPTGTPIMASGSGTVTRARWCGGGGNCIKIKHNSTYETIYAHMKNFARGIKEGRKVRQGQIIGYVGSTGMSTGPHLHYEVVVNGKKINSQKLKLPSGKILKGDERKDFEIKRIKIDLKLDELRSKN
jgi:murein DD-endopeptidase MepM/ murein hydrolase activator NlpD